MNLTSTLRGAILPKMRVVREKFTESKTYAFTTPYYTVDVVLDKLYSDMCITCRRKTHYKLFFIIHRGVLPAAPNSFVNCYCCGVQCMQEEAKKLDSQVIEWITC